MSDSEPPPFGLLHVSFFLPVMVESRQERSSLSEPALPSVQFGLVFMASSSLSPEAHTGVQYRAHHTGLPTVEQGATKRHETQLAYPQYELTAPDQPPISPAPSTPHVSKRDKSGKFTRAIFSRKIKSDQEKQQQFSRKVQEVDEIEGRLRKIQEELDQREQVLIRKEQEIKEEICRREQVLIQKEQDAEDWLVKVQQEAGRRKELNDRRERQLDDANLFLGMRLASDKAIQDHFSRLFDRISHWSQRYSLEGIPECLSEEITAVLRRHFFHSESREEITTILKSTTTRQLFARDLVAQFLCARVFPSFGLEDAPVDVGRDYWLEEEVRGAFSTLETRIYNKVSKSATRKDDVTHKEYNEWRAITADLLSRGQPDRLGSSVQDGELRAVIGRIREIFQFWDAGDGGIESLEEIVIDAIGLSRLLRQQRPRWSVILPGMSALQLDRASTVKFDPATMENRNHVPWSQVDPSDLTVRFFLTPTLYKQGNNGGDHFDLGHQRLDPKAEVWAEPVQKQYTGSPSDSNEAQGSPQTSNTADTPPGKSAPVINRQDPSNVQPGQSMTLASSQDQREMAAQKNDNKTRGALPSSLPGKQIQAIGLLTIPVHCTPQKPAAPHTLKQKEGIKDLKHPTGTSTIARKPVENRTHPAAKDLKHSTSTPTSIPNPLLVADGTNSGAAPSARSSNGERSSSNLNPSLVQAGGENSDSPAKHHEHSQEPLDRPKVDMRKSAHQQQRAEPPSKGNLPREGEPVPPDGSPPQDNSSRPPQIDVEQPGRGSSGNFSPPESRHGDSPAGDGLQDAPEMDHHAPADGVPAVLDLPPNASIDEAQGTVEKDSNPTNPTVTELPGGNDPTGAVSQAGAPSTETSRVEDLAGATPNREECTPGPDRTDDDPTQRGSLQENPDLSVTGGTGDLSRVGGGRADPGALVTAAEAGGQTLGVGSTPIPSVAAASGDSGPPANEIARDDDGRIECPGAKLQPNGGVGDDSTADGKGGAQVGGGRNSTAGDMDHDREDTGDVEVPPPSRQPERSVEDKQDRESSDIAETPSCQPASVDPEAALQRVPGAWKED
ncbi:hypothetical protein B0I37DRAFT_375815 [Chaetomium sp. MPI-CAGE-AT-0009]|nr:hypothetical protein B0I37DRAFT_375815 [Chaetomium sp. MPI-CAGE-AT-0009]